MKKICGVEMISPELNRKIDDLLLEKKLYSVIHKVFREKTAEYFFKKTEDLLRELVELSKRGTLDESIVKEYTETVPKGFVFLSPAHMLYLWDKFSPEEPTWRDVVLQRVVNELYWAFGREIHSLYEQTYRKQQDNDLGDLLSEEEKTVLAQAEEILFNKAVSQAEAQGKSNYARASETLQAYRDSSTGVSDVFSMYCLFYEIIHQFSGGNFLDYKRLLQEHSALLSSFEKKFIEEQFFSIITALVEDYDKTLEFTGVLRKLDIMLRISRVELPRLRKQLADKKDKDPKGEIVLARGYAGEFEKNMTLLKPESFSRTTVLIPAISWMADNAAEMTEFYPRDRETAIKALCHCLSKTNNEVRIEAIKALDALKTDRKILSNYYLVLFCKTGISVTVLQEGIDFLRDNTNQITDREHAIQSLAFLLRHYNGDLRKDTREFLEKNLEVDTEGMFTIYTGLLGVDIAPLLALSEAIEFLQKNAEKVPPDKKELAYDALLKRKKTHWSSSCAMNSKIDVALMILKPAVNLAQSAFFAQAVTAIERAI